MIQKLGKYQITEKLGEGAMGAVYKAYDEVLDRHVAVKTMASDIKWDPELKLRFYREARSAASLHHPNIVTIHDLGEDGKITFIVMELLQGKDLKTIIREKAPLSLERKLSIMAQVSEGLNHAHLNGIIHRDVKPGNIHVTAGGNVKILDFGIARIPSSDLTRSGVRLGTPVYMSPEQIRGVEYDERSDIFSAGIVFYELMTYVHPFRDKNIVKTMDNILFQTHFPFAEQFPETPPGLWPILNGCLAKEADKRYGSMAEVSRACRRLIDDLKLASQKMIAELEKLVPRLRSMAGQSGDPARLAQIYQEASSLLSQEEKPDYLPLQRLLSSLPREVLSEVPLSSAGRGVEEISAPPARPLRPVEEVPQQTQIPRSPQVSAEAAAQQAPQAARSSATEPSVIPPVIRTTTAEAPSVIPLAAVEPAGPTPDEIRGRKLMEEGEALLEEDRFQEAVESFRQAMGLLGPKDELVRLLAETRRRIEEHTHARAAEFLKTAREAVALKEFAKAIEALDEVLQLEPDHPEAIEMRRQARGELDAEKARQARKAEGEREKLLGFRLLAERKSRESLRALSHARELLGEDSAIQLGIAEAEDGIRREELQARVQSELAEATALFRAQAFDKARTQANRVLELSPRNPGAIELLARLERAEEEKRLRDKIAALCQKSAEALDRKDFAEAILLANEALQLNPADSQAQDLLRKIEQVKEETRRHQETLQLISRAKESQAQLDFEAAISLLESALKVSPQNAQVGGLLSQAKQAREEQRKEQEIAATIAQAKQSFLRGELDQCEEQVRKALSINPQHAAARDLRERVEQAREKIRKDQIASQIAQGQRALEKGDFAEARKAAQEALRLDPECAEAANLIQEVFRAEEQRKQDEMQSLLSRSRAALERKAFDEAADLANQVLELDDKNREAKSLGKTIEKARRAHQKELKKRQKTPERAPESPPAAGVKKAAPGDETWVMEESKGKGSGKLALWLGAAVVVIAAGVAVTFYQMRPPRPKPVDLTAQVVTAKASLDQRMYDKAIELAQQILAASPANVDAQAILAEAQKQRKQSTIDTLMMEAQSLRGQKQLEEADKTLQKILEIDPGYAPALEVRSQIEAEGSLSKSKEEQDKSIKEWVNNAKSFIAAGKVNEAKSEISKVERLRPDSPALAALRKQLQAASAKSAADLARMQEEQQEAAQKQARISELRRKASDLFSQGRYSEAQTSLDQWLVEEPQNAQAYSLRNQIAEALYSVKSYESAIAEKRYDEALNATSRIQKINPSDPNIAAYKKHIDDRKSSATATFSIFRLGEPCTLTLDDQPVGANGEIENKTVPIGRHKLSVKNAQGKQSTANVDLSDGQKTEYVYDAATPELRPFVAADRASVEKRRAREEPHSFQVEHTHGTFRGKCKGVLTISGIKVEYKTTETDHSFTVPFRNLKLAVREDRLEFTAAPDNKKDTFKLPDAAKAKEVQQLWERLQQLGK